MDHQVLVSVIIPTYNRATVIDKTIKSVLSQSYCHFELLIIDDCSSDIEQLRTLIQSYNDERIQLIEHQTNKNGAAARNTGIELAKGKFIAFLDSDDLWHKTKLAEQIQLSNKMTAKSIQYCKLRCYCSSSPNNITERPNAAIKISARLGDYLFVEQQVMQTSGLFLYQDFAKKLMFNERLVRHQDYDFLLRAEAEGANFIFINKPLVDYIWLANDRIKTKSISVLNSLNWLDNYKTYLSQDAQLGFIKKEILPVAIRTHQKRLVSQYILVKYDKKIYFTMMMEMGLVFVKLVSGKLKRLIS